MPFFPSPRGKDTARVRKGRLARAVLRLACRLESEYSLSNFNKKDFLYTKEFP